VVSDVLQRLAMITRNKGPAESRPSRLRGSVAKPTREKPDPLTMSEKQLAEAHHGLARKPPAGKRDLTLRH